MYEIYSIDILQTHCVCVCLCESVCVADLSGRLNALEETEEDDNPGQSQAAQDRETHLSQVPDIIRDVQHIVPEKERATLELVALVVAFLFQ